MNQAAIQGRLNGLREELRGYEQSGKEDRAEQVRDQIAEYEALLGVSAAEPVVEDTDATDVADDDVVEAEPTEDADAEAAPETADAATPKRRRR